MSKHFKMVGSEPIFPGRGPKELWVLNFITACCDPQFLHHRHWNPPNEIRMYSPKVEKCSQLCHGAKFYITQLLPVPQINCV